MTATLTLLLLLQSAGPSGGVALSDVAIGDRSHQGMHLGGACSIDHGSGPCASVSPLAKREHAVLLGWSDLSPPALKFWDLLSGSSPNGEVSVLHSGEGCPVEGGKGRTSWRWGRENTRVDLEGLVPARFPLTENAAAGLGVRLGWHGVRGNPGALCGGLELTVRDGARAVTAPSPPLSVQRPEHEQPHGAPAWPLQPPALPGGAVSRCLVGSWGGGWIDHNH